MIKSDEEVETMQNYVHDIPTKIYFGKGSISHLNESLRQFGNKVLLTYGGGSVKKTGLYDEILSLLKEEFEIFELSGIEPNPRISSVRKGVELCKEHHIDVILAVGGGSVIDCSKAIACGYYYEGDDLWDMITAFEPGRKALPLVDIVTLAATGSEYDSFGVISDPEINAKIDTVLTFPSVSICDPTYTFSVSKYQTASGSIDIMSHIMEGYFSKTDDSDLYDGIAETVLKSVIRNMPIALNEPDNYSARANLMADASIACSGIPEYGKEVGSWPCHAMEHELSAYYDITHGVGLAILTPRWMRHIIEKDPSCKWRFLRFARNVWGLENEDEDELAKAGIDALEDFFQRSGVPMTLSELNIDDTNFKAMAAHANKGNKLGRGFVPLDEKDIEEIYADCL